jgi:hypothetical protein
MTFLFLFECFYRFYLMGGAYSVETRLWAGWSRVISQAEAINLQSPNRPDWHWSTFSLTFNGYQGIFPQGQSDQFAKLSTRFYLMLRLGMNGNKPLLTPTPLHAFTPTTLSLPFYFVYINRHS